MNSMEDSSKIKENSSRNFDMFQSRDNSKERDFSLCQHIYGKNIEKNGYKKKLKEELSSFSDDLQDQLTCIFDIILVKIDEMMCELENFKEYSINLKSQSSEERSRSNNNSNIIEQSSINHNETREEIKRDKKIIIMPWMKCLLKLKNWTHK